MSWLTYSSSSMPVCLSLQLLLYDGHMVHHHQIPHLGKIPKLASLTLGIVLIPRICKETKERYKYTEYNSICTKFPSVTVLHTL